MTEHDTLASLDTQSAGKTDDTLLQDRHSAAVPQFPLCLSSFAVWTLVSSVF